MATPTTIDSIIKLRRGSDSDRRTIIFDNGEIVFSDDNKKTFIGDGSTRGGIVVGNHSTIGTTPNPSAVKGDTFYDSINCLTYILSSESGPDNILNYARINPVVDNITLKSINGVISINQTYFNNSATGFVHLSGDLMYGFLTLHSKPVNDMHAATKGYVNDGVSGLSASIKGLLATDYVHISGDNITGPIKISNTLEVTGGTNFKNEVQFNDNFIKRFKPVVKIIDLNTISDTHVLTPDDNGCILIIQATDICYIAIPNGLPIGFNALVVNKSTFTLSFKPQVSIAGVDIVNVYGKNSIGSPYGVCNMVSIDNDQMLISGDLI